MKVELVGGPCDGEKREFNPERSLWLKVPHPASVAVASSEGTTPPTYFRIARYVWNGEALLYDRG